MTEAPSADSMTLRASLEGAPPVRVQLSRAKGWRMPPNTVKVDRTTRWGNPFPVGGEGPLCRVAPDAEGATGFFRDMLRDSTMRDEAGYPSLAEIRESLKGKNLACWCAGPHCHADVLLEIANAPRTTCEGRRGAKCSSDEGPGPV